MAKKPRKTEVIKRSSVDCSDRISSLPDCILCHILSFLPTKLAAVTSILSRRWRYIFLSVPRIDLDDALFLHPRKCNRKRSSKNKQSMQKFMDFVNRLLMLYKLPCLDEFRLQCRIPTRTFVHNSWISAVLSRNVKVLDLGIELAEDCEKVLPSEIFTCETLAVLKLYGSGVVKVPKIVRLPNLKVLHLGNGLKVVGDSSSWTLSAGFPLLEELRMSSIVLFNIATINYTFLNEVGMG